MKKVKKKFEYIKCEECKKKVATLECHECGSMFCEDCLGEYDTCPYCEPPELWNVGRKKAK